ncbi:MAG: hypothetical protein ABI905_16410 [Betaproteobacteria bacterium]
MNKTLLIVLAGIAAVLALAVGGAVWWWKSHADEIMGAMDVAIEAGRKEGATLDEAGCLDVAAARHREPASQGLIASTRNGITFQTCLQVSRLTPDFCREVPSKSNPFDAANWAQQVCAKQGLSDPYCPSLMQQVTTYCGSERREAKSGQGPVRPEGKALRT